MGISAFVNVVLASAAIVCAVYCNSSAMYAFAMDSLLDMLCCSVVFWRFYGSNYSIHLEDRENTACLVLGVLFIISSIGIVCKGLIDLNTLNYPTKMREVFVLTSVASALCLIMAISKFYAYKKMKSQSLLLEAINTGLSAVLSILIIVAELLYHYINKIGYLDPLMSMIIALVLFTYGIRVIMERRRNIVQ
ncbi:transmembrane protein 163-like [Centruroides sculpturatus]|uniref:transmembrane protein 163-like n=1 Tax=Centruroides sculpturatus TaxID=218467 RepID=UPI000C6E8BD8|nr:transmembrane protein 163-like [Centruroides sculpturatus]